MKKKLLIVDDSEIDREVLKNILDEEFEIVEAENGYAALEVVLKQRVHFDAILLDVSMPVLDGFSVLRLMQESGHGVVPVFMITAEATKENVEKAMLHGVAEFIRKPFDRDEILKRIKAKLGMVTKRELTEADLGLTKKYIADLEAIYGKYLKNVGKDSGHYERMTAVMKILLNKYAAVYLDGMELDQMKIEIISKAAYFCDIGEMVCANVPGFRGGNKERTETEMVQGHTIAGSELIRLNYEECCQFFVQVCADMCVHHHERYDGTGFPHRILGKNNSVYTQMCGLADRFDTLFFKYRECNEMQFDFVVSELVQDRGAVSREVFALLEDSKQNLVEFYMEQKVK